MAQTLANRVIVVTGAQGALGKATVSVLMQQGAQVAALDIGGTSENEPGLLRQSGVDATQPAAMAQVLQQVASHFGRIDGLVNIAGGFIWKPVAESTIEDWERMNTINLRTALVTCQATLPHFMQAGGGRIVNVGALAAQAAGAGMAPYAAAKAGVARLTEALAEEHKDRNITVNAVLPSILDTPANRVDMPDADFSRWVSPADLAGVIAFLLSDAARAITGALLPVRGRV